MVGWVLAVLGGVLLALLVVWRATRRITRRAERLMSEAWRLHLPEDHP